MSSITSSGFDGIYGLYDKDGNKVKLNTVVKDHKGTIHTIQSAKAPQHAGSTGRVYTDKGSYFPSVFDLKFVNIHPDSEI